MPSVSAKCCCVKGLDDPVFHQTGLLGANEQMQQQIRRPLERGAASETDQMLIDERLLARGKPGDV